MGDNTGRENQTCFLRRGIDRPQQATACKPRTASARINGDLLHFREVDHQAAIASAESCKTMSSTADRSKNSRGRGDSNCVLNITYIAAARDKARCSSHHAIPNDARVVVTALTGTEQLTFELSVERRVDLFAGFAHFVLSPCRVSFRPMRRRK